MRDKLTARQQDVLAFIERQVRETGIPPSVREMGEALGMRGSVAEKGGMTR